MGFMGLTPEKKRTIKFWELWDKVIASNMRKNESMRGDKKSDNFYIDFAGIYSGVDNVTYLYTIDKFPSEVEILFRQSIRRECKQGVRVSFISLYDPHKIAWSSPNTKARLRTWRNIDRTQGETDIDDFNLYDNIDSMGGMQWRKTSLRYLSKAERLRKRKTFTVRTMMLISGKRGADFDETVQNVVTFCEDSGFKITRLMLNIQEYLKVFSPFSLVFNGKVDGQIGKSIYTDELIARFSTYSQGIVGTNGIVWGSDIFSGFPCLKPTKITTETAENWLITAETGGGKSLFVKVLLLQLLANKYYNATVMDIEGFEYIYIAYYLRSIGEDIKIINMAEGQGSYFDPVEIIITGDELSDEGMKSLSSSFTISMLKTLVGSSVKTNEWVSIIIEDAVATLYRDNGVTSDMKTWVRSKGLTLFDVFDVIKRQDNPSNKYIEDVDYKKALDITIGKLRTYFDKDGARADIFTSRVTIRDIQNSKLVVCSFGMAGKSPQTIDPVQMGLMQLCAANISHLRAIFSKTQGRFNIKIWEEFQRWGHFPDSEKTITTALTGGRKLGDINIILTNLVSELLATDRFKVFENVTSYAIGAINDANVRAEVCRRLSIVNMTPELDTIAKFSVNKDTTNNDQMVNFDGGEVSDNRTSEGNERAMDNQLRNPYCKAFLIGLDRSLHTIARMDVPTELRASNILKTGVSLQD